jgi:hypothetical protein
MLMFGFKSMVCHAHGECRRVVDNCSKKLNIINRIGTNLCIVNFLPRFEASNKSPNCRAQLMIVGGARRLSSILP